MNDQAVKFLNLLFKEMTEKKFYLEPHWDIDHLCYRVETEKRYLEKKDEFAGFGELLIESQVGGRMISTFKLKVPIEFKDYSIGLIELPAPKPGKTVKEGFEHIEVICDLPFHELKARYSSLQSDESGLKKDFNKELEFNFKSGAVKFHHLSLESVIELEKNETVWITIKDSKVLEVFGKFDPLIAGTFPLGIQVADSDVDLLIQVNEEDFDKLRKLIKQSFKEKVRIGEQRIDALHTMIASFVFNGLRFEVFAQNWPPSLQKAYRHFQAEEKLLKYGGPGFRAQVKSYRAKGHKTEAAFAESLRLSGNPYMELLALQKASLGELKKIFAPPKKIPILS
jgi:predicted metalloenzyme YecM